MNLHPGMILAGIVMLVCGCQPQTPYFEGFSQTSNQKIDSSMMYLYAHGDEKIRLTVKEFADPVLAEEEISRSSLLFESIFQNTAAAYPGMITQEVMCDERFVPKLDEVSVHGVLIRYADGYASQRLSYGSCDEEMLQYRSLISWFYCQEKQQVWQLEYLTPKNAERKDPIGFLQSYACV